MVCHMGRQGCEGTYFNELSSCSSTHFLELELNLVPIFLKFVYRRTELNEVPAVQQIFLELELNLVPF